MGKNGNKTEKAGERTYGSGQLIRRFYPYLRKYRKLLYLDLFFASLTTLCDIVLPMIMRQLTNSALGNAAPLTAEAVLRQGADLASLVDGNEGTVYDLSGCTLDQMLYFVGHGHAVQAITAEGPRTIVGYDEFNTYLLRPGEDEWYYYGMNDSTDLFAQAGNVFYTVMPE